MHIWIQNIFFESNYQYGKWIRNLINHSQGFQNLHSTDLQIKSPAKCHAKLASLQGNTYAIIY